MNSPELSQALFMLSRLPGLGPRSARRLLIYFLKKRSEVLRPLITALNTMDQAITICHICHSHDTQSPCTLCTDITRNQDTLCVVADVADVWALERSKTFRGYYHVLGGVLSAVEGVLPSQLTIESLTQRIEQGTFTEVILALNATVEGQTTMHYIADILRPLNVRVSTLAHGVPVGGELDYLDDGTLYNAFIGRRTVEAA